MSDVLKISFGDDGFATIQMTNGENRFRNSVLKAWDAALDRVLENSDVKGLVITGAGKFFSSGIDLQWMTSPETDSGAFIVALVKLLTRITLLPVPSVALINGHAFGAGAFLALACDFRVMQPDRGWLCWPETAIGLPFSAPLLALARCKMAPGVVQRDALIYSKRFTAQDALNAKLVDMVTKATEMEAAGKELVTKALGPKGLDRNIVRKTKRDIYGHFIDLAKL